MSREDIEYFQQRAELQIELAQRAENPSVVQAHYQLASAYLDRIEGAAPKAAAPVFSI
jgi:hypothetical protein